MNKLNLYGLTDRFISESNQYRDFKLARIIKQNKGSYNIVTDDGLLIAEVSGKFRHEAENTSIFPSVGDFVMVSYEKLEDKAIIHHILRRKSVFVRSAVGGSEHIQVVAANIDIVFLCMALNNNYSLNRLERYLAIAWDSGAKPVIVLTKSDLCDNLDTIISEVETASCYADIITTNMYADNVEKFKPFLSKGITATFIGSSGVGKSTLINEILGEDIAKTNEIGVVGKGKHTTTARELYTTPLGGVVIDTPGMRELGARSVDLEKTFVDIDDLATKCKFNNCTHRNEPDCAVQKALEDGLIDQRRIDSYNKLKNEASYDGLSSKQIEIQKTERMFKDVGGIKKAKKFAKEINKRK